MKIFLFILLSILVISIFFVFKLSNTDSLGKKNSEFLSNNFNYSLKGKPSDLVKEVAVFEDNENWSGDSDFDYNVFVQGRSSLTLNSLNGSTSKTTLDLKDGFKLSDYSKIKLFVEVNSPISNISNLNIYFTDQNAENIYKYKIFDAKEGWNFLTISTKDFVQIGKSISLDKTKKENFVSKLVLELASKPKTAVSVNFDYFWAEKEDNYLDDWLVSSNNFFSIVKSDSSLSLFSNGVPGIAIIKKIENLKDFNIKAKFNPLSGGSFGFFLRGDTNGAGYYFIINRDIYNNYWQIFKLGDFGKDQQSVVLANGVLDGILVSNLQNYWLKVVAKGSNFDFYVSPYDNNYTFLGKIKDTNYSSGKVGVVNTNSSLFKIDNISISEMSFN